MTENYSGREGLIIEIVQTNFFIKVDSHISEMFPQRGIFNKSIFIQVNLRGDSSKGNSRLIGKFTFLQPSFAFNS